MVGNKGLQALSRHLPGVHELHMTSTLLKKEFWDLDSTATGLYVCHRRKSEYWDLPGLKQAFTSSTRFARQ